MRDSSDYMLEVIGKNGHRVGPMEHVNPTQVHSSFADYAKFVLKNHSCPRVIHAVMYDPSGKVIAAESMPD